jgi:hypothetical protein
LQLSPGRRSRNGRIAASLATATCSLLGGTTPGPSIAAESEKDWKFDTAVLYYGESGDRVIDYSLNVLAKRLFARGRALALRLGIDSLTGASPSGAVPASTPQTFTTPSGRSTYTTPSGATPLDDSFLDTRYALSADWEQPLSRSLRATFGGSFSSEYDYMHAGANGTLAWDLNQRNTTLSAGLSLGADAVNPVGGAPIPFAPMLPPGNAANKLGSESKTVADLLLGVTQVLGPRTLAQVNYSYSRSSGYLNDPYKLITVVDPVTGAPVPGPGTLNLYLFESRPDTRAKHSLFVEVRHHLRRDVIDGAYRFMTDDWGVRSQTLDLHYRWRQKESYLQPHVRYYSQSAADFYVVDLFDGDPLPAYASADYRLGEFDAYTLGLKYGRPSDNGKEWAVRVEYYEQSGRAPPGSGVGELADFDLYPGLDAVILQVGYSF